MCIHRKSNFWYYLLSFTIPVMIIVGVMIYLGITPFGDRTVFIWDAKLQHKDYYGYLWDVLHGNASFNYSPGKSLGGRMIGLIGFYISSPLNFLLYFFEKSQIPTFMALIIVLKIGLCGITSQYYIRHRYSVKFFPALFLSTAYALMEYNIFYCRNSMWLDGVIFLPLMALGIYRLLNENKRGLFYISVTLAIISNWYTGYMLCFMSALYFVYEYFIYSDFHPFKVLLSSKRVVINYIVTLALSVLTSSFMLLPACLALVNGKATDYLASLSKIIHFDPLHFFSGFEIEAAVNNQMAPVIFCSAFMLISTFCYFFVSSINWKEKLLTASICMILILSFCLQDLELLWTAFVKSSSYYFRFSFVVPFFMLVISARFWTIFTDSGVILPKYIFQSIGLILGIFYILFRSGELKASKEHLILYGLFFILMGLLLVIVISHHNLKKDVAILCLSCMLIMELTYNSWNAFREYKESNSLFVNYMNKMQSAIEELKLVSQGEFFRLEKNESYLTLLNPPSKVATCESLMLNYNSIEHYSSAYDDKVDEFLAKIGYSDLVSKTVFPCETYWNSPMILPDALLAIKYVLLPEDVFGYQSIELASELPFEGIDVYRNNYALPLAYNVSATMENVEFGSNPYENQNALISAMLGRSTEIYQDVLVKYEGFDDSEEIWNITTLTDGPLYLYIDSGKIHSDLYADNCEVYVNGQFLQKTCSRFVINSMHLGDYEANENIEIRIRHNNKNRDKHTIFIKQLEQNIFEDVFQRLKSGYTCDLNFNGNTISGTYETSIDSKVFFSVPYENSWRVFVDGEEVSYQKLAGTFLGIDLKKGTHEIWMEYSTPGLKEGIVLSGIGGILFSVWQIISLKKRGVSN